MSQLAEPVILVASAEFTLKSYPVRRTLEQRLTDDLRFALSRAGFTGFRVEKDAARLVVIGLRETDRGAKLCSRIFGVAYAAPALLLPASLEAVLSSIVKVAEEGLRPGQSFAVRAHRSTSSPISRREVELKGGSEILRALRERGVTVDLEDPDLTIHVDLVGDRAYVYSDKLEGPAGLPLSSQWKMLAVLDSGALSLLAAYAMMRRGCLVELFIPISNVAPIYDRERQLNLAKQLRELVTRPSYRAFTVDYEKVGPSKRLLRTTASKFAKENRFKGIVFADAGGEINLTDIPTAAADDLPVFTPLMGLDAGELEKMAESVGLVEVGLSLQLDEDYEPVVTGLEHIAELSVEKLSL